MLELYKELIIDHYKNPRNKFKLINFNYSCKGYNHFCGDFIEIFIKTENNEIKSISFEGEGCSISIASASIMTKIIHNKYITETTQIINYFNNLITEKNIEKNINFDDLNILTQVKNFPSRVKCATLVWHTLKTLINENKLGV